MLNIYCLFKAALNKNNLILNLLTQSTLLKKAAYNKIIDITPLLKYLILETFLIKL
jgi:hypothetical protein